MIVYFKLLVKCIKIEFLYFRKKTESLTNFNKISINQNSENLIKFLEVIF